MKPLDPQGLYVVGVSFGPDSMALLDMLIKEQYRVVVCHVNYHKRPESNQEAEHLTLFCREHQLPLFVENAPAAPEHVNFQAWARDIRYRFFTRIYARYHADALLVAHQKDDDLETFWMQKTKKKILPYYGIRSETVLYGMRVIRPLLSFRKAELERYCIDHHVPYSIDRSNEEDHYERNRIRHHLVSRASDEEIAKWEQEQKTRNEERATQMKKIATSVYEDSILLEPFLELNEEERLLCLHTFIAQVLPEYALSRYKANMIYEAVLAHKPNWHMLLTPPYAIVKAYDRLYLQRSCEFQGYLYRMEEPSVLDTPYFYADFVKDTSDRNIFAYDYPLTIRTFEPGDALLVKTVRKPLRRLFIDWKMPLELRKRWPIFVNRHGEIVYVPRYRVDFKEPANANLRIKSKLGI